MERATSDLDVVFFGFSGHPGSPSNRRSGFYAVFSKKYLISVTKFVPHNPKGSGVSERPLAPTNLEYADAGDGLYFFSYNAYRPHNAVGYDEIIQYAQVFQDTEKDEPHWKTQGNVGRVSL